MIHNIRLGHACNSSSTHSIVPAAKLRGGSPAYAGEYGWSWFELLGEEEKMHYFATLLKGQLAPEKITEITGATPAEGEHSWEGDYVDHQSSRTMPSTYREEFTRDLAAWLRRPEVAIRGGNDNEDAPYEVPAFDFAISRETAAPLARPDLTPDGERYWTVYYPRSGDKVRFSFDAIPVRGEESWEPSESQGTAIPYGSLPELVDLKLTAYCPFEKDCPWCYMDSTTKGRHATKASVKRILKACAEAGVFEIAVEAGVARPLRCADPSRPDHGGALMDFYAGMPVGHRARGRGQAGPEQLAAPLGVASRSPAKATPSPVSGKATPATVNRSACSVAGEPAWFGVGE